MNESSGRTELIVGFFVLVTMVVLFLLVILVGQEEQLFERRIKISATFGSVGGLLPGAAVRLAGIQVGQVSDISLTSEGKAKLSIALQERARKYVSIDSIATVETQGLLGDRIVSISLGNGAPIEDGQSLQSKDPVDMMVAVTDLLGEVQPGLTEFSEVLQNLASISRNIEQGVGLVGRLLSDEELADNAAEVVDGMRLALENVNAVTEKIRVASEDFPDLVHNGTEAFKSMISTTEDIRELSTEAKSLLAKVNESVGQLPAMANSIEQILVHFEEISGNFVPASEEIAGLIRDLRLGVSDMRDVVRAIKVHPLIRPGIPELREPTQINPDVGLGMPG